MRLLPVLRVVLIPPPATAFSSALRHIRPLAIPPKEPSRSAETSRIRGPCNLPVSDVRTRQAGRFLEGRGESQLEDTGTTRATHLNKRIALLCARVGACQGPPALASRYQAGSQEWTGPQQTLQKWARLKVQLTALKIQRASLTIDPGELDNPGRA